MHGIQVSVTFGERRGWNEGLPGLDWACVVLTAFVVADVHFVLASVAREAKRHVIFMVGLGSDRGRIGLEWVLFSFAFPMKMLKLGLRVIRTQHAPSLWVAGNAKARQSMAFKVGMRSDRVGMGCVHWMNSHECL